MKQNAISKNIMRRVYYAYTLRLMMAPLTLQLALLCLSIGFLTRFVSFGAVFNNILAQPVGEVGSYLYAALFYTESQTLVLLALALTMSVLVYKRLRHISVPTFTQQMQAT